jgi:hypothetical protein
MAAKRKPKDHITSKSPAHSEVPVQYPNLGIPETVLPLLITGRMERLALAVTPPDQGCSFPVIHPHAVRG